MVLRHVSISSTVQLSIIEANGVLALLDLRRYFQNEVLFLFLSTQTAQ